MQGAKANLRNVRNLAYLASSENDQIFKWKAEYVRCATCVITRGVSSIRVFYKALGHASDETGVYRHATFSFCADGVVSNNRRGKRGKLCVGVLSL